MITRALFGVNESTKTYHHKCEVYMSGKNPLGNSREPQSYEGLNVIVPIGGWQLIKSTRAPTTNDKKYPIGSIWINTSTSVSYQLVTIPGIWTVLGSAAGGDIQTLTGDSGGAILPTAGNITLAGTSAQGLTTSGAGSTITFTNSDWTTAQKGVGVLSTNAQAIAGVGTTQAVTPAALQAKVGTQTAHGVAMGNTGATSAISWSAAGTAGQVFISGGASADGAYGNIVTSNIVDSTGTTQAMAVSTSYVADHASATVVFTLPSTATLGQRMEVVGNGPGGWQIAQNASQKIVLGSQATTVGTGGSLSSSNRYDAVQLYCVVAGASTVWNVISSSGSLTFV
jgi:hypothetical protein